MAKKPKSGIEDAIKTVENEINEHKDDKRVLVALDVGSNWTRAGMVGEGHDYTTTRFPSLIAVPKDGRAVKERLDGHTTEVEGKRYVVGSDVVEFHDFVDGIEHPSKRGEWSADTDRIRVLAAKALNNLGLRDTEAHVVWCVPSKDEAVAQRYLQISRELGNLVPGLTHAGTLTMYEPEAAAFGLKFEMYALLFNGGGEVSGASVLPPGDIRSFDERHHRVLKEEGDGANDLTRRLHQIVRERLSAKGLRPDQRQYLAPELVIAALKQELLANENLDHVDFGANYVAEDRALAQKLLERHKMTVGKDGVVTLSVGLRRPTMNDLRAEVEKLHDRYVGRVIVPGREILETVSPEGVTAIYEGNLILTGAGYTPARTKQRLSDALTDGVYGTPKLAFVADPFATQRGALVFTSRADSDAFLK